MALARVVLSDSEMRGVENAVRELIEASEERERAFLRMAGAVEDEELASVLEHYASKHCACAIELRENARVFFHDIPPRRCWTGEFVRVRTARPTSHASVLAECILYEDAMLASYERFLLRSLPLDVERTVRRHHALITAARSQLSILCTAEKAE